MKTCFTFCRVLDYYQILKGKLLEMLKSALGNCRVLFLCLQYLVKWIYEDKENRWRRWNVNSGQWDFLLHGKTEVLYDLTVLAFQKNREVNISDTSLQKYINYKAGFNSKYKLSSTLNLTYSLNYSCNNRECRLPVLRMDSGPFQTLRRTHE